MLGLPFSLDTLLTLPLLSIFLIPQIPSYFSWTTTLNLLLFYATWSTLVLSHQPLNIEFFSILGIRTLFYVLPSLFFLVFDYAFPPNWVAGLKSRGARGLPSRVIPRGRIIEYIAIAIGNVLLSAAFQTAIDYIFTRVLFIRSMLRITTLLPSPFTIAKDITKAFFVRELLGYYIHRFLLHISSYTPSLSKVHQKWQHSLTTPIPLSIAYDHPFAYLLKVWLPTYAPAVLWRFHILTYLVFLMLVSSEETMAGSGYGGDSIFLPSTILLRGVARRNERHFESCAHTAGAGRQKGNFSNWGVMDWVHGSGVGTGEGNVMDDLEEEAEKRGPQVRGKARKAAQRVRGGIDGGGGGGGREEEIDDDEDNNNDNNVDDDAPNGHENGGTGLEKMVPRSLRSKKGS